MGGVSKPFFNSQHLTGFPKKKKKKNNKKNLNFQL